MANDIDFIKRIVIINFINLMFNFGGKFTGTIQLIYP